MIKAYSWICGLSLLVFILDAMAPFKDTLNYFTLFLGSLMSFFASGYIILSMKRPQFGYERIMTPVRVLPIFGILLEIIGGYFSHYLAPFHITAIPFSFYLIMSFIIILQLNYTGRLISNKVWVKPTMKEPKVIAS